MPKVSVPTTCRLPSALRLPTTSPVVRRSLGRLSRRTLIALALEWLDGPNATELTAPFLSVSRHRRRRRRREEEDGGEDDEADAQSSSSSADDVDATDPFPPCASIAALRASYDDMTRLRGSAREVADRIAEGDWRHGLTLYQLATADLRHLHDHPSALRWTAYQLHQPGRPGAVPRLHPSTFIQRLQAQVPPDAKTHFHFDRPPARPLLLLHILLIDSPYNNALAIPTVFHTIHVAFPDAAPYVYISAPQAASAASAKRLRGLVMDGVPRALSRPRARFALLPAALTSRNLDALLARRSSGPTNAAYGPWAQYATAVATAASPLDPVAPTPPSPRHPLAYARFGDSALPDDGQGVERVDVLLQDPFSVSALAGDEDDFSPPSRRVSTRPFVPDRLDNQNYEDRDADGDDATATATAWTPHVRLAFHGPHVFAGLRQLVEAGVIDGARMPGWMSGEDGVTIGTVRHGRISGRRGSGGA